MAGLPEVKGVSIPSLAFLDASRASFHSLGCLRAMWLTKFTLVVLFATSESPQFLIKQVRLPFELGGLKNETAASDWLTTPKDLRLLSGNSCEDDWFNCGAAAGAGLSFGVFGVGLFSFAVILRLQLLVCFQST